MSMNHWRRQLFVVREQCAVFSDFSVLDYDHQLECVHKGGNGQEYAGILRKHSETFRLKILRFLEMEYRKKLRKQIERN